jgi:isoamylase
MREAASNLGMKAQALVVHPVTNEVWLTEHGPQGGDELNLLRPGANYGWPETEGPTDDPEVGALRARQQRNLLATLLLSQGVPMLLGGDEFGRSQHGNNNAYCQDNELSWYRWDEVDEDLLAFTRHLVELRKAHPVFRRRRWFQGRPLHGASITDIGWFTPDGEEMDDDDWEASFARSLVVFLNGRGIDTPDLRGEPIVDDSFLVVFNGHHDALDVTLPPDAFGQRWEVVVDTTSVHGDPSPNNGNDREQLEAGQTREVVGRSLLVLREVT